MSNVTVHPTLYVTPFSAALKRLREQRRLTQSALARAAGLDHSYTSRLESGDRRPSRGVVIDLAAAMSCTEAEMQSLLVCAGFAPAAGLTIDADLLALNEVLASDRLPLYDQERLRDVVRSLVLLAESRMAPQEIAA